MESIVHNPMIPYSTFINGGFQEGRFLRVQGIINQNAHSLKINLMCGPAVAHDDIALHLDFRFSEQLIIRNNKSHGNWGTEERHGPGFPLVKGQGFEVMVLAEPRLYKIAVNGQHYTEFNQRVPIERISHIGIEGDVDLSIVQFDGGSSSSSGPLDTIASAPPPQFSNPHGYAPTGAAPYPPGGGSSWNGNNSSVGFVAPPPLPNYSGPPTSGYPPGPPGQGYGHSPQYYPPGPGGSGQYGPGPGYGPPPPGQYDPQYGGYLPHGQGGYPQGPGGGYAQGGYPNQGYPSGQSGGRGGGILGSAQKLLAGVGLAGVASKIPGMGGGSHGHGHGYPGGGYPGSGYPGGSHGGHGGGGGFPGGAAGGILGSAAALGIGGALASKMMKPKKMKKNKLLKYGLGAAGIGAGGYAVHKGMKGFRRGSWSGSSSSSSSD